MAVLDIGIAEVLEIGGRVKAAYSLDPATDLWNLEETRDTHGHGSRVAGLIAGSNVCVAPGVSGC